MKQNLKLILSVLAGNFLLAFCVCAFVIPNNIMLGGANGISLFVQMFLPEVRLSVISACVNISLFILGWLFLGWKFAATSLTSTIIYPLMLAVCDAMIAAQNAVTAAESFGIGSCYIGDIMENCEAQRELLCLPEYVFPVGMVIFGYPTDQQVRRPKPERVNMENIVHENGYKIMDARQLEEMWAPRSGEKGYVSWMQAFCNRKYNSDFSRDMTRSVEKYLEQYK